MTFEPRFALSLFVTVQITMLGHTVRELNLSGLKLALLKAVGNSDHATRPLLWALDKSVSPTMKIIIGSEQKFFTSPKTKLTHGSKISVGFRKAGQIGQTLFVKRNSGGAGVVKKTGDPTSLSFHNGTRTEFGCGLMQSVNGCFWPYCAAPLHGSSVETFEPDTKILLGFTSAPTLPGTVLTSFTGKSACAADASVSQLFLVDLGKSRRRNLKFCINSGWSAGGAIWATSYPASAGLVSILVTG